jgi:hypothetical protein
MRLGMVPENVLERLAIHSGMLPPGIFECWFGIMLARTVMVATRLDVFESLAVEPLTTAKVARPPCWQRRAWGTAWCITRATC